MPLFPVMLFHQAPPKRAWLYPPGSSLQVLVDIDEVPSEQTQAEETQFSHPFLIREMLQPLRRSAAMSKISIK